MLFKALWWVKLHTGRFEASPVIEEGFPARFTGCQANLVSVTNEQLNVAPDFVRSSATV